MVNSRQDSHPKLEQSPLIHAICQVRFSPVLKIAESVPDIQEALRKSGYPIYEADQIQEFVLGPQGYTVEVSPRWLFLDAQRTQCVALANSFLTIETAIYNRFDDFQQKMSRSLELVHGSLQIGVFNRVGLRYINLIQASKDKAAIDFLNQGVRGINFDSGVDMIAQQYVTQLKTQHGELTVRIGQSPLAERGPLPTDLLSSKIKLKQASDKHAVLLDIDHYLVKEEPFDLTSIKDMIWNLHEGCWEAFVKTVTPETINTWKGGAQ